MEANIRAFATIEQALEENVQAFREVRQSNEALVARLPAVIEKSLETALERSLGKALERSLGKALETGFAAAIRPLVRAIDDMRDQIRANTEATWRMLGRLDGGAAGAQGA